MTNFVGEFSRLKCGIFLLLGLQWCLFYNLHTQPDTETFVSAIQKWAGEEGEDRLFRLSKPLALLLPLGLYKFLHIPPFFGLLIQQILAFWLGIVALHRLFLALSGDKRVANSGILLYAGSACVGVYGLAGLVDMSGWALSVFLLYKCLIYTRLSNPNFYQSASLGIWLGIGIFVKESVLIAGLGLFWWVFLSSHWSIRTKFLAYLQVGLIFVLTVGCGLWLTGWYFDKNVLDWILFNHQNAPDYPNKAYHFVQQTLRSLDTHWFLVGLGIFGARKHFWQPHFTEKTAFLVAGISGLVLFPFLWGYYMDRILFMFAPFWIYWAAVWLAQSQKPILWGFLSIFLNILASFLVYQYPFRGILWIIYIFFGLLLIRYARYPKYTQARI
jgi:hypothetical protein